MCLAHVRFLAVLLLWPAPSGGTGVRPEVRRYVDRFQLQSLRPGHLGGQPPVRAGRRARVQFLSRRVETVEQRRRHPVPRGIHHLQKNEPILSKLQHRKRQPELSTGIEFQLHLRLRGPRLRRRGQPC